MKLIKDVKYFKDLALDFYIPNNEEFTTIIYFHGGGLTSCDKADEKYREMGEDFSNNGYAFVSVNYSLYPHTKFPQYLIECAKAVKYVIDNISNFGKSKRFVVSGQSAGAWISAMLLFNTKYLENEGIKQDDISAWIIESGQMTSHFNVLEIEDHLNPLTQRIDERAPLYFVNENTQISNVLFIYYSNDMLMRKEQNILLYTTVKAFNKDAKIELLELEGSHCQASCSKDKYGRYKYVKVALEYLKTNKI